MMNHLWMPRLTFLGICVFGIFELVVAVVHNSLAVNLLLQEDGSLPDRDQVRTMFSLLSSKVFYSLYVSSLVFPSQNFQVWIHCLFSSKFSVQDLKPRFHSSRFHGSDVEDDVCSNIIFVLFAYWNFLASEVDSIKITKIFLIKRWHHCVNSSESHLSNHFRMMTLLMYGIYGNAVLLLLISSQMCLGMRFFQHWCR